MSAIENALSDIVAEQGKTITQLRQQLDNAHDYLDQRAVEPPQTSDNLCKRMVGHLCKLDDEIDTLRQQLAAYKEQLTSKLCSAHQEPDPLHCDVCNRVKWLESANLERITQIDQLQKQLTEARLLNDRMVQADPRKLWIVLAEEMRQERDSVRAQLKSLEQQLAEAQRGVIHEPCAVCYHMIDPQQLRDKICFDCFRAQLKAVEQQLAEAQEKAERCRWAATIADNEKKRANVAEAQLKPLVEALEWYASEESWKGYSVLNSEITRDCGTRAKAALAAHKAKP